MTSFRRVAVCGAAAAALATPILVSGPAAHAGYDAHVTIHATDQRVQSGEQFRVHGKYLFGDNTPVRNRMMRVQTKKANGNWVRVKGAKLRTNSKGRYRIRVALSRKGLRKLRVRAQGPGPHAAPLHSRVIRVRVR